MDYWGLARSRNIEDLEREGFKPYRPRMRIVRIVYGRKQYFARLMFPGYVFIPPTERWERILKITHLFLCDDKPARVQKGFVEGLIAREVDGLIVLPPKPRFERGSKVRAMKGPLVGLCGLYEGATSRQCERALFEMMGQSVSVEFRIGDLESVED